MNSSSERIRKCMSSKLADLSGIKMLMPSWLRQRFAHHHRIIRRDAIDAELCKTLHIDSVC
jgi:hypothetical protein